MRRTPKFGRKRKLSGCFFIVKKRKRPLKELLKVSGLARKHFIYHSIIEIEFGKNRTQSQTTLLDFSPKLLDLYKIFVSLLFCLKRPDRNTIIIICFIIFLAGKGQEKQTIVSQKRNARRRIFTVCFRIRGRILRLNVLPLRMPNRIFWTEFLLRIRGRILRLRLFRHRTRDILCLI